jgi:hypothetical protein
MDGSREQDSAVTNVSRPFARGIGKPKERVEPHNDRLLVIKV